MTLISTYNINSYYKKELAKRRKTSRKRKARIRKFTRRWKLIREGKPF